MARLLSVAMIVVLRSGLLSAWYDRAASMAMSSARAVYVWSATPLQWILQYRTPVEWTPVGVGVEWSEPSPTPVLQWTPRLNLG
jgi:hypothetical protein